MLWKHDANSRGLYPIYLRITINRKTVYLSTGKFVSEKLWDGKNEQVKQTHPEHSLINPEITAKKNHVSKKILEYILKEKSVTAKEIKHLFSTNGNASNIFDFVQTFMEEVKHKREPGTLENYRKHLKKLEEFNGSKILSFDEINMQWLSSFENKMRKTVGGNYAGAVLGTIRTFFNAARRRGITNNYPFQMFEMPEYLPPVKDILSLSEIQEIEKLADETTNFKIKQTCIYFLLGCYTGLRVSDWYRFDTNKHVQDDHIIIRAQKNKRDLTIPISDPLRRNLERIRVTPLQTWEQDLNETLKVICSKLNIQKKLTTHSARHSFAVTICLNRKISSETAAQIMGITLNTFVGNYSQVTQEKINKETSQAWKDL